MRSQHSRVGRRVTLFVAALSSTLGAACSWSLGYLDSQSNANLDAGGSSSSSTDSVSDDSAVPSVDASGSGDAASDASDAGGGNLIVNPSCENATLGWTTVSGTPLASSSTFVYTASGGPPGADAAVKHSCYSSMRTDGYAETNYPDSSYDGPLQDVTTAVLGGHEYSFSVWALWAPPGAVPAYDVSDAGAGADADAEGAADAVTDAMTGSDAADASQEGGAANEAGTTNGPEEVYATAKETCNGSTPNYVALATSTGVAAETWTQLTGELMVPTGCTDIAIYIGGPNVGMDLYTDEATLLFVQ